MAPMEIFFLSPSAEGVVLMATSCGTPDTGAGRCRARESSYRAVLICKCVAGWSEWGEY